MTHDIDLYRVRVIGECWEMIGSWKVEGHDGGRDSSLCHKRGVTGFLPPMPLNINGKHFGLGIEIYALRIFTTGQHLQSQSNGSKFSNVARYSPQSIVRNISASDRPATTRPKPPHLARAFRYIHYWVVPCSGATCDSSGNDSA